MTVGRVSESFRSYFFTHGRPDGHNGTQGRSRFSNPGRFGYSTFASPVQYSYKRDARTSLFRSYQFPLHLHPAVVTEKQDSIDVGTLKAGIGFP
jgi:hypothetical protein